MKLMGYELPLGISITQHAPEMVDGFVENGFEYFEVGIPACLNREDAPKMPWRGHEETLVNTKLPLVEKIFSHNLRVWSVHLPFGFGWDVEFPKCPNDCFTMITHKCIYQQLFTKYGMPEMTAVFCEVDDLMYSALPRAEFIYTEQIGRGGSMCDYTFKKR